MANLLASLMYHSISEIHGKFRSLGVSPARFREQLMALREAGYEILGQSEALDRQAAHDAKNVVALTFDDGYISVLDTALDILTEVGATATLYMAAGHLGQRAVWLGSWADGFGPILTQDQVREVAQAGVEIGSHGFYHRPLDVLSREDLDNEIRHARLVLEDTFNHFIRSFCYPHGYHNRRVRAAVSDQGHDNACEIGRRLCRPDDDRFAVPRFQVTEDHRGADLVHLVQCGGPWLSPTVKRLAQPGWRITRLLAWHVAGVRLT